MIIFLVVGNTGEYSDYVHWNVRAFEREEDALTLSTKLNEIGSFHGQRIYPLARRNEIRTRLNEAGDPNAEVDYNGTEYRVEKMELQAESRRSGLGEPGWSPRKIRNKVNGFIKD